MIKEFVDIFINNKHEVEESFQKHPDGYKEIVKIVVELLNRHTKTYNKPDPTRIHEINDGDYQGTLVYVFGETGYQPNSYWGVCVDYGSCSGCDTLEGIAGYSSAQPSKDQIKEYTTLCLHVVQKLKKISNCYDDDEVGA